ncbi:PE-PPE domain-containing protein [Mycolicibacterium agri]|uniref:PE-PPE domain-containing protein n=1 Tax=Mycolicibacterium agri TaxID=36811 RepID=A0A2A7MY46_MYCAG|nr:PE-PPE domain-containing protein [Mycolicibacterium agri]PEG36596.1 PE-PPE domain-containing protein [Mycolicibacterium agri]GFG51983.1 PE-PPE domain-containing protein [Mycolicibacterium agri]
MRATAGSLAKSITVAIFTVLAALILGVTQAMTTAVTAAIGLTAYQAIIVPGTGTQHPAQVPNYLDHAVGYYLIPAGDCGPSESCAPVTGVEYLAQFWPIPLPGWGGLKGAKWNVSVKSGVQGLTGAYDKAILTDDNIAIFGYSQGATVASMFKDLHRDDPEELKARTTYFFIGNPQRPDGGVFERLAILGTVPILDATFGNPTPTDTCERADETHCASDFALMYDGVVDFPEWILNPLAIANAAAGFEYVHGTYLAPDGDDPLDETPYGYQPDEVEQLIRNAEAECSEQNFCQRHGDTIYITLPARFLPLYQPFIDLAEATGTSALVVPLVDLVSPLTQTLIETAYTRDDYGKPSPVTLLPRFNPIAVAGDLVRDIPEGIQMALEPGRTQLPGSPGPVTTSDMTSEETSPAPLVDSTPPVTTPDTTAVAATTAVTNDDAANDATKKTKAWDGKPLTRLSLIATPGGGASNDGQGKSSRPIRDALKNFHPVRDVVKAVKNAAKDALGNGSKTTKDKQDDSSGD